MKNKSFTLEIYVIHGPTLQVSSKNYHIFNTCHFVQLDSNKLGQLLMRIKQLSTARCSFVPIV